MYELKKIDKVFTSKIVGPGPSSYKKRIYRAAVSQRLRNTVLECWINKTFGRNNFTFWGERVQQMKQMSTDGVIENQFSAGIGNLRSSLHRNLFRAMTPPIRKVMGRSPGS
jgi:hypothetical protein